MENPLVTVIIVNFNGASYIEPCLQSLQKIKTKYTWDVVFVDNASSDSSIHIVHSIADTYPVPIKVVQNTHNTGFALGNNIGITHAKGTYLLFLNCDTQVESSFLDPLIERMETNHFVGAVQPTILMQDAPEKVDSIGSYFLNSGFLYHLGHNKPLQRKHAYPSEVFSLKGACMLFRKSVISEIGPFNEAFFAYFEETDLCIRTLLAGYSLWYEPRSTMYHKGGASSTKLPSQFVLFHSYKNRILSYASNFELRTLIWLLPVQMVLYLCIATMYFATVKFELGIAVFRALFWNMAHVSYIRTLRKKTALFRKKRDSEVLVPLSRTVSLSYYFHLFTTSLAGYQDR